MNNETAVNIEIDNILMLDKWKRIRPQLESLINKNIPRKAYKRNDRVVVYRDSENRIGSMKTINGIKTVDELKEFLLKFDNLRVE